MSAVGVVMTDGRSIKTGLAVFLLRTINKSKKKFTHRFNGRRCYSRPLKASWTLFTLRPGLSSLFINCSMQLFHLCWHDPKKTTLSCTLWLHSVLVVAHPYNLCSDNKHKSAFFRSVMILMLTLIRGYGLNIICRISLLLLGNISKCGKVLTVWWNRKAAFSLRSEIENIIWYSTGCQWKISR